MTALTFKRDRIGGVDGAFFSDGPALVRFDSTGSVFLTLNPHKAGATFTRVTHPDYEWAGSYKTFKQLAQMFVEEGDESATN